MSTRYMKKLYGGDIIGAKDDEDSSDVEAPINGNVKLKSFNVYHVFNQISDNEDKEVEQDTEEEIDTTICSPVKSKKKRKKQKKPNSTKPRLKNNSVSKEQTDDEIERTVREVNKLLGEPAIGPNTQNLEENRLLCVQKSKEQCLTVQHVHLNPYNELKRIFGSKTIHAQQSKPRNRGHASISKRLWLVTPRDNWAPIGTSGLSMRLDDDIKSTSDAPNVQYFVYEHSPKYRQTQLNFLEGVESLDPENLVSIITAHPYHVDALLQLAELCQLNEDLPMAAELTERALYCLEHAFHPLCNITLSQCRFDYRKQQNRALFIALFKHLTFIGGRACYRTSLEFCKLLLSLDPEGDPLAVILTIDFYALKAGQEEWFIEFCSKWESTRNLSQLPNIAYSLALAQFHLGNKENANEALQNALIMFPGVLVPLLDKCGIQTDTRVLGHDFFNSTAKNSTPPSLEKLQRLYVIRNFHLWKEAQILPWLQENVHAVLDRVDKQDNYVRYCTMKRGKRYGTKLPRNISRHIILLDMKEVTVNGEEILTEGPVMSFDPLPPADSIDIYKKPTRNNRPNQSNSNYMSAFLTSLFPNLNRDDLAAAVNELDLLHLFEENDDRA